MFDNVTFSKGPQSLQMTKYDLKTQKGFGLVHKKVFLAKCEVFNYAVYSTILRERIY